MCIGFPDQNAQGQLVDFETAKNQALSSTENGVSDDIAKAGEEAKATTKSVSNLGTEVDKLNGKSLSQVQLQFVNVSSAATTAKNKIQSIIDKINALNGTEININSSDDGDTNGNGGSKPKKKAYHGTVGNAFARGTFDDIPDLPITGYNGLPKDEHNALRSEYGQPELTVYPNGKTELTTEPTMGDLPKGTIIFNEKQTKKIMNDSGYVFGKAYASGTVKKTSSKSTSKSKSKSKSKDKKSSKTLIDWIERRFNVLIQKAERWSKLIENATNPKRLDSYYKKLEENYKKQLKSYSDGATRYLQKANSIKLSSDLKNKVKSKDSSIFNKDGSMKSYKSLIKEYGEKTAKKIQDYQNYIDKYESAIDSFIEATQKLYQSPIEKAADKIELLSESLDLLDAKLDNISVDDYKKANANLDEQSKNAKAQLEANKEAEKIAKENYNSVKSAVTKKSNLESNDLAGNKKKRDSSAKSIKDAVSKGEEIDLTLYKAGSSGYKAAVKYNAALKAQKDAIQAAALSQEEYTKTLRENTKAQFDNVEKYYESKIGLLDNQFTSLDNKISEIETAGKNVNKSYYQSQKKLNEEKKKQYETEKKQLEAQLSSIPKGTDEWYDAKDAIQECDNKISDCVKTTYDLNNAINELHFSMFEDVADAIDRIITEQEFLQGLFAHEKLTDDKTGDFTDAGFAKLGSLSASYYASKEKAEKDAKEIAELQRMKDSGILQSDIFDIPFNSANDLQDKLDEMYTQWQNDIKETYSLESDIADLMKEKYQAELDMLQKLIDAKKKALDSEKDLHSYQQSIQQKTKDISSIQKQIAALRGDTSEEGIMRIQKLQKELADKREDLQQNEYDRYISDQQDMLDKLYDEYEDLMTNELEDFMALVQKGLTVANENTSAISSYLSDIAGNNGYIEQYKGLFTTVSGSIEQSANKIIEGLSASIKSLSGTEDVPDSKNSGTITVNGESHGTGYNKIETTPMELTTKKVVNTIPNITPTTKAIELNDGTNALSAAKSYIKKHAVKASKKKSEYSDVNKAIYDNKAKAYSGTGKVLSDEGLKGLAKELGIKYDNSKKSGKLYTTLKKIKFPGFKKGGIAKLVKSQGEDGFMLARNGEGFIAPEHVKPIEELVDSVPQINNVIKTLDGVELTPVQPDWLKNISTDIITDTIKNVTPDLSNMVKPNLPNLQPVSNNMNNVAVNIDNITLPNVTNYEEFKNQMYRDMQNSSKFEKMVRCMSTDRALGGARLAKNKVRF